MNKRRLKIAEQIIIMLLIAVLIPMVTIAIIIVNVNQHAVRSELQYSATILANGLHQRLIKNIEEKQHTLNYISKSFDLVKKNITAEKFMSEMPMYSNDFYKLDITKNTDTFNTDFKISIDDKNKDIIISKKIKRGSLNEYIKISSFENDLFKIISDKDISRQRSVYIIDSNNRVLMKYNDDGNLDTLLSFIPEKLPIDEPVLFSNVKNQPNVIIKMKNPNWSIIVTTPKDATTYAIKNAKYKIIFALIFAAGAIIVFGAIYTYSLYVNIRQLFKAIAAVAKGNYKRRIRIIKNIFTPYEVVFLTNEINKMAKKINESYSQIRKKNLLLQKMDKYKSNLIDTVSHEFRTPLTSIKGYTSRLLRHDIELDDDMKKKSLKVIKQQTERLGRMVEDLLVIPDIESSALRVNPTEIDLKETIENCIEHIKHKETRNIILNYDENVGIIYADSDRTEQIFLNLLENAVKYSKENSDIVIEVSNVNNYASIKVQNEAEQIHEQNLEKLFEKFSRLDNDLTRTSRGTGLGLFIVKGLVDAMGGKIKVNSDNKYFTIAFTLPFAES